MLHTTSGTDPDGTVWSKFRFFDSDGSEHLALLYTRKQAGYTESKIANMQDLFNFRWHPDINEIERSGRAIYVSGIDEPEQDNIERVHQLAVSQLERPTQGLVLEAQLVEDLNQHPFTPETQPRWIEVTFFQHNPDDNKSTHRMLGDLLLDNYTDPIRQLAQADRGYDTVTKALEDGEVFTTPTELAEDINVFIEGNYAIVWEIESDSLKLLRSVTLPLELDTAAAPTAEKQDYTLATTEGVVIAEVHHEDLSSHDEPVATPQPDVARLAKALGSFPDGTVRWDSPSNLNPGTSTTPQPRPTL